MTSKFYIVTRVVNRIITVRVFPCFAEALKTIKEEFFHALELENLTDEDREDFCLEKKQAWIRGRISEWDWQIDYKEVNYG